MAVSGIPMLAMRPVNRILAREVAQVRLMPGVRVALPLSRGVGFLAN